MSSDEQADHDVWAPPAEGGDSDTASSPAHTQGPPRWLVVVSAALALAAFVVAAWFGTSWWIAEADDEAQLAATRDKVASAAHNAVLAYTEVDYRNLDAFFKAQRDVATGELLKMVKSSEKQYRQALEQAKTQVASTVQDVAVEELNAHEGKASALAMVKTDVKQGKNTASKVLRLEVKLTRVDSGGEQVWKLSGIGDVPVAQPGK